MMSNVFWVFWTYPDEILYYMGVVDTFGLSHVTQDLEFTS